MCSENYLTAQAHCLARLKHLHVPEARVMFRSMNSEIPLAQRHSTPTLHVLDIQLQIYGSPETKLWCHDKWMCHEVIRMEWRVGHLYGVLLQTASCAPHSILRSQLTDRDTHPTHNTAVYRLILRLSHIFVMYHPCVNRIYTSRVPTNAHKYTKISSIHTMNTYMFRPTMWPSSGK